jgi:predicted CXXCH cytochrome family protein
MSIVKFFLAAAFVLLVGANSAYSLDLINIHYPPDKIYKDHGLLGFSLSMHEDTNAVIKVTVNDKEKMFLNVDEKFTCFTVPLEPGVNTVNITAFKKDVVIDIVTREVFRRSSLISQYVKAPPEYKKDNFHINENKECSGCHILEPSDYDLNPVRSKSLDRVRLADNGKKGALSNCFSCHNAITSYPYVHGPANVWSCLSCHDAEANPRYSIKDEGPELCYQCHTEQKKDWLSKKIIHGPVNMGKCTICHSPHSSDHPFNLYKATWHLCTNCHDEKKTGVHLLAKGHPTRGREDPIRVGKELSCGSCHNPHASNFPHLWVFEVKTIKELCQKCHQKKMDY